MGFDVAGFGAIADFAGKVLDRFVPDPAQKAAALLELQKEENQKELAQMANEVQLAQMQTDVNKAEAASSSVFVAGWRPWCGWICGTGFGMIFVVGPLLEWTANLFGHAIKFPILDTGTLTTLLMAMLGMAGLRSYDKKQQTDNGH